jgi:hypothetical protein
MSSLLSATLAPRLLPTVLLSLEAGAPAASAVSFVSKGVRLLGDAVRGATVREAARIGVALGALIAFGTAGGSKVSLSGLFYKIQF